MPRNRYTRLVHERDEVRLEQQIRDLRRLAWELRHQQPVEVVELPVLADPKARRRARLEQKRSHRPERPATAVTVPSEPTPVRAGSCPSQVTQHSTERRRPMSNRPRTGRQLVTGLAMLLVAALSACGVSAAPHGELAENQTILAACDPAAPPASLVEIDGTGSSASDVITKERMATIESIVRTTAVCSGRLRVLAFSSTSAATTTLFDAPLQLEGATDNARLKRVPKLVEDVMSTIRKAYAPAVAHLDQRGSDITAQYRLGAEWISQLGGKLQLHLYVLTDGFQTAGVNLYDHALSKQEAVTLAKRLAMPKLTGATVVVAGLGRVAGTPPSSKVVEGLVAFYDELCKQSGAAKCVSVTDYTQASQ